MENILETAMMHLLRSEPFFASMLLKMNKEFSDRVPTAGVYVKDRIYLVINPEFFGSLTLAEQIAVLKHEVLHCVNDHFSRYKQNDKKVFNIAADIAINQCIKNIPQTFMVKGEKARSATIENYKEAYPNLKPKESAEYYYKEIYKNAKKITMKIGADGEPEFSDENGKPIDDHEIWEEGYESEELVKQVLAQTVNNAVEDAKRHPFGMGSIPGEVLIAIDKLNRSLLDWKGILRKFVANSSEVFKTQTRTKRNRRFGLVYPGDKTECNTNISAIIDTSGSMSSEQLAEINGEMMALVNNSVDVTLIQCDAMVHGVEKFTKRTDVKFRGGGGTSMLPGFNEAKKHTPDAIICFTDGYIPNDVSNPKVPVLWVVTGNKDFKWEFGRVIHIP